MPVVIANFPSATPGCQCETCKEIREAERRDKEAMRQSYRWPK